MGQRRTLYVAGFVASSLSYIFNGIAFTGVFDVRRWIVFVVIFFVIMYGFETILDWTESLDS